MKKTKKINTKQYIDPLTIEYHIERNNGVGAEVYPLELEHDIRF